jgi:hypothetical protein
MNKVKVRLVQLGTPPVTLKNLLGWKSEIFEIVGIHHVPELPKSDLNDPKDTNNPPWAYSKGLLTGLMDGGEPADVKMGVINVPLEHDYFMHRLSDHTCVLTLHDMGEILTGANIPLETFVIRNLYEMVVMYLELGGSLKSEGYQLPHEDTRGCLFDFSAYKSNVIWSTENVNLCSSCKSRLKQKQLPLGFIDGLEHELKGIRKPLIFTVLDWVKRHPIWSMAISALVGLALSILGNIGYAVWLKKIFEPLPKP